MRERKSAEVPAMATKTLEELADILIDGRGEPEGHYDSASHKKLALHTLRRFGMQTCDEHPEKGLWDGKTLWHAGLCVPSLYHELAHFQVAPARLRRRSEFGCGAASETDIDYGYRLRPVKNAQDYEERASILGILWLRYRKCPWARVVDEHCWNHPHEILAALKKLYNEGFISLDGTPLFVVR